MLQINKLRFFIQRGGLLEEVHWSVLKQLLLLCSLLSFSDAKLRDKMLEREAVSPATLLLDAPAMPELPLPAKLPFFHKPHRNHLNPYGAPAQPPNYGHFVISAPPSNSGLSKPSMEKSGTVPASASIPPPHLAEISPAQPEPSTLPAGLAQPPLPPGISNCCGPDMVLKRGSHGCHCVYPIKLDILLLNVSSNPNWNLFLEQFASQLGLRVSQIELINFYMVSISGLNISMDITPHTGISFSASEAAGINSSLSAHKVHLDPALVGDYQLLNITWFKPPLLPQAIDDLYLPEGNGLWTSQVRVGKLNSFFSVFYAIQRNLQFLIRLQRKHLQTFRQLLQHLSLQKSETAKFSSCCWTWSYYPDSCCRFCGYTLFLHISSEQQSKPLKETEATNNFEPGSILGEGGFGRVFKGVLSDGTAVAIKRLSSGGQQGDKEFLVEVEMLSRLHHRNLVKLVGYYSNRDSSQNLLCYELVPNGSLEAWLHGPLGLNCPLDWDTRMKIALDAARGLAYLHEDSQPCVIHRDFKASNILLENNFHAKVSDFGLAKQAPEGRANYLSTRVMGTFGYVAPEYAMTGHLLVKSDVYSYGVVLLELLTGRKPVDMSQPSGQENLVTWARPILRDKDRLEELADPRLEGKYPKEDFFRVCTIAAACVAPEASQRPTMGEVVQSLKMVQRIAEYHDSAVASNTAPNLRQSSTTFESDGTSSMFSSGPYSGLSAFENDHISRTAVFSEDLQEGR
ncbi:Receptor-like serine/threonine-protein kinase ALE2 [Sesamum angolense]|uniref:Receptor-like serine/threonine-protein kinase ALE2 n=2 Tax=Sesamum TaxID=4181 RepID=A0AAE1X781_9LAMI|nr:Receptor-like serine/threonine-protein kinase ALE2 [Sesamum angolense]